VEENTNHSVLFLQNTHHGGKSHLLFRRPTKAKKVVFSFEEQQRQKITEPEKMSNFNS